MICAKCNVDKDIVEFYGKCKKKYICSKCHNAYTIVKGQEKKAWGVKYLGGKCCICGYNKSNVALDFHHTNAENKDAHFVGLRGWALSRLKKELDNCVLLCNNCHREVHAGISHLPVAQPV